ncbi:MAG: hypothetical protein AAF493_18570 [Pseudomonadota bacterium]
MPIGALLRIIGALGDLWVDEVWSIALAASLENPLQAFVKFESNNNHLLNTWFLFGVGGDATPFQARAFAVVCGVVSIPAAALAGRRFGASTICLAALFSSVSYLFVVYTSEARGYAPMIAAIWFSLMLWVNDWVRTWRGALCFAVVAMTGFLAHPTFLWAYMGFIAVDAFHVVSNRTPVRRFLTMHALPALGFVGLYWILYRHASATVVSNRMWLRRSLDWRRRRLAHHRCWH